MAKCVLTLTGGNEFQLYLHYCDDKNLRPSVNHYIDIYLKVEFVIYALFCH